MSVVVLRRVLSGKALGLGRGSEDRDIPVIHSSPALHGTELQSWGFLPPVSSLPWVTQSPPRCESARSGLSMPGLPASPPSGMSKPGSKSGEMSRSVHVLGWGSRASIRGPARLSSCGPSVSVTSDGNGHVPFCVCELWCVPGPALSFSLLANL